MKNIDDLMKEGLFLNPGDAYESVLLRLISIQLTNSEILRRLIELGMTEEAKLIDPDKANKDLAGLMDGLAAEANSKFAKVLAELAARNKKGN